MSFLIAATSWSFKGILLSCTIIVAFKLAPCSISRSTMSSRPPNAAMIRGVVSEMIQHRNVCFYFFGLQQTFVPRKNWVLGWVLTLTLYPKPKTKPKNFYTLNPKPKNIYNLTKNLNPKPKSFYTQTQNLNPKPKPNT